MPSTTTTTIEPDRTHVERLDPNGPHGIVVCMGCFCPDGRRGRVLGRRCACHPNTVAKRVSVCRKCRMPQKELAEAAAEACAALAAGKAIPKRGLTEGEATNSAQQAFDDWDEQERRHP